MFSTDIIKTFSGHEQRSINWAVAKGRWNIATGIKGQTDIDTLIAFYRARYGKAVGFRFKDWSDYRIVAGNIGIGDSSTTEFQLKKQYSSGSIIIDRIITKPVTGTVTAYIDGTPDANIAIDTSTGIITFTSAPANSTIITVDAEFDVPVRFDTDQMDIMMETDTLGRWSNIPVVEVRI